MDVIVGLVWLMSFIAVTMAGEYCWTDYYDTEYCSSGCCGNYPNEYCCGMQAWAIILIVMGVLFFISIVIAVLCCWHKKKGQTGRVMATPGQATVTTVNYMQPPPGYNAGFQPGYQPGYQPSAGFQPQPPAYGQANSAGFQPTAPSYGQASSSYPPPAFGAGNQPSHDPAYPPPPAKY